MPYIRERKTGLIVEWITLDSDYKGLELPVAYITEVTEITAEKERKIMELEDLELMSPEETEMAMAFVTYDAIHLNDLAVKIHYHNRRWWEDLNGNQIQRNVGEAIALCHSELSEALEGHRKNLPDDKLPHRRMLEVELADAVIRILDLAEGLGLNLGAALVEKCKYNLSRHDHTIEGRKAEGGKAY